MVTVASRSSHSGYVAKSEQAHINDKITGATSPKQILDIWKESHPRFNDVNYTTSLNRLSKMKLSQTEHDQVVCIAQYLANEEQTIRYGFQPSQLATSALALAKLGICCKPLFDEIQSLFKENADFRRRCNHVTLARFVNAFSKLGYGDEALFKAIGDRILQNKQTILDQFSPQDISMVVNSFAKRGFYHLELFEAIAERIVYEKETFLKDFNPQNIALILNAFAKVGNKHEGLFNAIEDRLLENDAAFLYDFNSQDFANTTGAYAKFELGSRRLFGSIEKIILLDKAKALKDFTDQGLANTIHAFAKAGFANFPIFEAILERILNNNGEILRAFSQMHLSLTANALTKVNFPAEVFFNIVQTNLLQNDARNLKALELLHLAIIARAFAKFSFGSHKLFSEIEARLLDNNAALLQKCDCTDISCFASAFAQNGTGSLELFQKLKAKVHSFNLADVDVQSLCNICWSFVVANELDVETLLPLLKELERKVSQETSLDKVLPIQARAQLHQVTLSLHYEAGFTYPWNDRLIGPISTAQDNRETRSSDFQDGLFAQLKQLKTGCVEEYVINGLAVDAACPAEQIAIEAHGPTHYLQDTHEMNGKSRFKARLIEKMGYKVLIVPYWEWYNESAPEEKRRYLKDRLDELKKVQKTDQLDTLQFVENIRHAAANKPADLAPIYKMVKTLIKNEARFDLKKLVLITQALGKLRIKSNELITQLAARFLSQLDQSSASYFSIVVRSLYKMGLRDQGFFNGMESKLLENNQKVLCTLNKKRLKSLNDAFKKSNVGSEALFVAIAAKSGRG